MPTPTFRFSELSRYPNALDLLAMNARGRVWLIGGFIFRTLAGIPASVPDIDVVVELRRREPKLLPGWQLRQNSFGGTKLVGRTLSMDLIEADGFQPCARRGLPFTPENFLGLVPLTVQAFVFDVWEGRLYGDAGWDSIRTKTVGVNNADEARRYCAVKGIRLEDFVTAKAAALGFRAVP